MMDLGNIPVVEMSPQYLRRGQDCFSAARRAAHESLAQAGFALLRETSVKDAATFASAITMLGIETQQRYGDLPLEGGHPGVFRTTEYPSSEPIFFHSEASHTANAPQLIAFTCLEPALVGGTTPLSDNRRALSLLPGEIVTALTDEGLLYQRAFIPGLDISWQQFFGTDDRSAVARLGAAEDFAFDWRDDGILHIAARRRAILAQKGEQPGLFQQIALHHPAFLDPDLRADLADVCGGVLPRNVVLGNGKPLPDEWALTIHDAQCSSAFTFKWEASDVLLVDNVRMSHARTPFAGTRRHLAMLGQLSLEPLKMETSS